MTIRKGLGRNLDALLGVNMMPAAKAEEKNEAISMLPIDSLQPGKYQPRNAFDQETLAELVISIKSQGIIQPLVVRPISPQRFEILAGERRWRAAKLCELTRVPVIVRDVADKDAIAIALIENIQRENLNPLEEASALERLLKEFSLTHQEVANAIGRSRTSVSNLLRLMNLAPEVKILLESKLLDMGHARALLSLEPEQQVMMANRIISEGLTVRDVESKIQSTQNRKKKNNAYQLSSEYLQLQKRLSEYTGQKVELKPGRKGAGKIIIHYKNHQEFKAVTSKIEPSMGKAL